MVGTEKADSSSQSAENIQYREFLYNFFIPIAPSESSGNPVSQQLTTVKLHE